MCIYIYIYTHMYIYIYICDILGQSGCRRVALEIMSEILCLV